jgi:hypothetical protein
MGWRSVPEYLAILKTWKAASEKITIPRAVCHIEDNDMWRQCWNFTIVKVVSARWGDKSPLKYPHSSFLEKFVLVLKI